MTEPDEQPETGELFERTQWTHESEPGAVDRDRSFAFVVALWVIGFPLFVLTLVFLNIVHVESGADVGTGGLVALVVGFVVLVAITLVLAWRRRKSATS